MTEPITIKCSNNILEFWASENASYTDIYDSLLSRLTANASFYSGCGQRVVLYGKHFSDIQKRELRMMLSREFGFSNICFPDDPAEEPAAEEKPPLPEDLFLMQTVRSGQFIKASGNITVIGDINAGAEIIAGGSIAVFGKLRGLVHAGAFGRQDVFIIANRLMANQIRIGGKIAVLPQKHKATEPELVKLSEDGKVVISSYS